MDELKLSEGVKLRYKEYREDGFDIYKTDNPTISQKVRSLLNVKGINIPSIDNVYHFFYCTVLVLYPYESTTAEYCISSTGKSQRNRAAVELGLVEIIDDDEHFCSEKEGAMRGDEF